MAYGIENETIVKLAACPQCGAKKSKPCTWRVTRKRKKGEPCTPHPPRVQEAKRIQRLQEPYHKLDQAADNTLLQNCAADSPQSREMHARELADFLRSCQSNERHTAIKVGKRDLEAMIAEIIRGRLEKLRK